MENILNFKTLLGSLRNSEHTLYGISFTDKPIKCLGIYIGHNKDACYTKNWEENLIKLETTLNSWKQRRLTFFGKVVIIKTLGLSKLIYRFNLLPVPDPVIKKVKRLSFDFLWNKKEFVKRTILYNKIYEGGINMLDIDSHITALKAAWVPRFIKEPLYFDIISECIIRETGLSLPQFLRTNFRTSSSCPVVKKLSQFYQDIFTSYNKCKSIKQFDRMSSSEYFSQIIWCNELFKVKNKCICFKNWINSGIIYVKDLFTLDGMWMSEEEIIRKLIKSSNWITEFLVVKKAIGSSPLKFNTSIANFVNIKDICILYHGNCISILQHQRAKFFYEILRDKLYVKPFIEHYWEKKFGCESGQLVWKNIYTRNVLNIEHKKIAEFNFKILHNILPCGKLVSKWDSTTPMHCLFCQEVESIEHMLFECSRVKNIWMKMSLVFNVNIQLKHIIIGFAGTNPVSVILNAFINFTAYSIYKQWIVCKQSSPNRYGSTDLWQICLNSLHYRDTIFQIMEDKSTYNIYHKYLLKLSM